MSFTPSFDIRIDKPSGFTVSHGHYFGYELILQINLPSLREINFLNRKEDNIDEYMKPYILVIWRIKNLKN